MTSGEDAPGRDPLTYRLEGSNDGKTFTLISEGDVPAFTERKQKKEILFDNNQFLQQLPYHLSETGGCVCQGDANRRDRALKKRCLPKDDILARAQVLNTERINAERNYLTTTLIAQDLPADRKRVTKILDRGEYDKPIGEALNPGVFSVLGGMSEGSPQNRLGLAEWLVSDEQPLTTRVLVNRFWLMVFGEGLVRTPEEFGLQGEHPTHPELLDWLAVDFRENGWDLQRLFRQLLDQPYLQAILRPPAQAERIRKTNGGAGDRPSAWMRKSCAILPCGHRACSTGKIGRGRLQALPARGDVDCSVPSRSVTPRTM